MSVDLTGAHCHIKTFIQLFYQSGDVLRVVLAISIHENQDIA